MMSPTNAATVCRLCGAGLGEPVYNPVGTRREAVVYVCLQCGYAQSRFNQYVPDRVRRLSCDADWGNVRHGKAVRLRSLTAGLQSLVTLDSISRVLDVGSNRGAFVRWCHEQLPTSEIIAIEPDATVIDSYALLPRVTVLNSRLEHASLPIDAFDLIHLSHTLEHLDNPLAALTSLRQSLRHSGVLVCEVPNIAVIRDLGIVEEFFIDKHVSHFDDSSLRTLFSRAGFVPFDTVSHPDSNNLLLIARKSDESEIVSLQEQRQMVLPSTIAEYSRRMELNRGVLPRVVDTSLRPLASRLKVFYWGAGRIFDALVKYGGLQADDVHGLVDRFLAGIVEETHGVTIGRPESLRLHEPQALVVLARTAEEAIAAEAYSFGVRNVIKFSELLSQFTDRATNGG